MSGDERMNIETERRLSILETTAKNFEGKLGDLGSEVYQLRTAVNTGLDRVNASLTTLTIAQSTATATKHGERQGLTTGAHILYLILAGAAALIGAIVTAWQMTQQHGAGMLP